MARAKKYLDTDVLTAARSRIEHIYATFDHVAVMFSGGKDSLATLLLVKEYHEKHDLGPVPTVFRHEEVINPSVTEFVETFRHLDWCKLYWLCTPMQNHKFILGEKHAYTEWDPDREWVGVMPEWAITEKELAPEQKKFDQYTLDDAVANYLFGSGKVAFITGIRASESLMRFRSVTQKLNENYISSIEHNERSRVKLCKPIYDWEQADVFKWIAECNQQWCKLYEAQEIAGIGLRVSTALHVQAAKKFGKLAEVEPDFFNKITEIFPDMLDQARYWDDFDQDAVIAPYLNKGFNGVMRYIEDHVADNDKKLARERARLWKTRHDKDPQNYPIETLLKTLAFGIIKHRLSGVYVDSKSYKEKK